MSADVEDRQATAGRFSTTSAGRAGARTQPRKDVRRFRRWIHRCPTGKKPTGAGPEWRGQPVAMALKQGQRLVPQAPRRPLAMITAIRPSGEARPPAPKQPGPSSILT